VDEIAEKEKIKEELNKLKDKKENPLSVSPLVRKRKVPSSSVEVVAGEELDDSSTTEDESNPKISSSRTTHARKFSNVSYRKKPFGLYLTRSVATVSSLFCFFFFFLLLKMIFFFWLF
jgi:hypothetical protein